MKKPDVRILGLDNKRHNQIVTHWRATPDQRASLAMDLIKIMATMGFDLKPGQIVERAMKITHIAYEAFHAADWIIEFPSYEEMEAHDTGKQEAAGFRPPRPAPSEPFKKG